MKAHLISFRMMYGFMSVRATEMVEMASRKKKTSEKVVRPCQEDWNVACIGQLFSEGRFFRKAISPISMARMAMKAFII